MRSHYTNSLKHALLLQSGSGDAVMSLAKDKQLSMWHDLVAGSVGGLPQRDSRRLMGCTQETSKASPP